MSEDKCQYEKMVLKKRKMFFIFATLSILMPALSVFGFFKPSCEALGVWFQRSGATTVVFAIFAEMNATQMLGVLDPSGMVGKTFQPTYDKYLKQVKAYNYIALFLVIFGTVIWGYGDLLINKA
jgi:hypothetical protein